MSDITDFCSEPLSIKAAGLGDKKILNNYKKPDLITIQVREDLIPKGAKLVECYLTEREVIICGEPLENHDCDQMGCSTMSHVIHRFQLSDSYENKEN